MDVLTRTPTLLGLSSDLWRAEPRRPLVTLAWATMLLAALLSAAACTVAPGAAALSIGGWNDLVWAGTVGLVAGAALGVRGHWRPAIMLAAFSSTFLIGESALFVFIGQASGIEFSGGSPAEVAFPLSAAILGSLGALLGGAAAHRSAPAGAVFAAQEGIVPLLVSLLVGLANLRQYEAPDFLSSAALPGFFLAAIATLILLTVLGVPLWIHEMGQEPLGTQSASRTNWTKYDAMIFPLIRIVLGPTLAFALIPKGVAALASYPASSPSGVTVGGYVLHWSTGLYFLAFGALGVSVSIGGVLSLISVARHGNAPESGFGRAARPLISQNLRGVPGQRLYGIITFALPVGLVIAGLIIVFVGTPLGLALGGH